MAKYKYNFVLFCKTYSGDFDRFKILKESIDKYNIDSIPFCIACPKNDLNLFKSLKNNKENYDFLIFTDEEILLLSNKNHEQNWFTQQTVKLSFYKTNTANHYAIIDSDCYFVKHFFIDDFMYDNNTPYLRIYEVLHYEEETQKLREFFHRKGRRYTFCTIGNIFSTIVLEDMEKNFLIPNNLTFQNLIDKIPSEFNWYFEWFQKCNLINFKSTNSKFKIFYLEKEYRDYRKYNTLEDIKNNGYIAILMQNRWVSDVIYKPSIFVNFNKKYKNYIDNTIQELVLLKSKKFNFFKRNYKKIEIIIKNLSNKNNKGERKMSKKLKGIRKRIYMFRDLIGLSSKKYNYKNNYTKDLREKQVAVDSIYDFAKNFINFESFSEAGEDRILNYIFYHNNKKLSEINYVDVGCHTPTYCNNTYLFYKNGAKGVLVEPNSALAPEIKKYRSKDILLECGVGFNNNKNADYYFFKKSPGLNTFDKKDANNVVEQGIDEIDRVEKIKLITLNEIFNKYFQNKNIDLVNIDVEGAEYNILSSIDFTKFKPFLFCVEINANKNKKYKYNEENPILGFIKEKGYDIVSHTPYNVIFINKDMANNNNINVLTNS